MPVETMDPRNMSSFYKSAVPSSLLSGEIYIPSEKHVGFWKTASMPDHHGLDVITSMSGGKPVSSLPLESMKNNFLDNIELSQNFSKKQQSNIHFDKPLMDPLNTANSQRTPNIDAASQKVSMKTGYYENSLFSSSMSDLFNRTRGLTLNNDMVHQLANTVQSNLVDGEPFKCSEEIEAQAIGDLLPDDDDMLFDAIHNQGPPQSNWADAEDDLFCSVGSLELESDDNIKFSSQIDYSRIFNCQEGGLKKPQPSRMLVIKNVDSNIDDAELKIIFEQFGNLQAFHTFYKHQGIIVASYYDIRAAQNAERMLGTMKIMGKKLDIQFYSSKEIHSENQTCDGVVLITNVDILNDEVLSIFNRIGEIKDIHEIRQNRQCKIIEFYDVRAAGTALSSLNGYKIAGKRIKVEPLCLRDSRLRSMQKSTMDVDFEESGRCRQEIYPEILPSECYGTSSHHQNGAVYGSITPRNFEMSSNIPRKIPSPLTFSVTEKSNSLSGNCELSHSLGNLSLGSQSMPSFPKINGVIDGMQFSSPSTVSAMAMNMNMNSPLVANENDSRRINRSGTFAHSGHFEHNKSAYNSGTGSFPPHSHEHIWNGSGMYHNPGSLQWQNMQPFVYSNSIPIQTPHMLRGLSRGPSHILNHVMTPNHHGGSAPSIAFHRNSLESVEYSSFSPLHLYDFSSQNVFPSMGGLTLESSVSSTLVGTTLSQPRAHIHRTKSNVLTSRGRRSHSNVNQLESSSQYDLDVDRIACGEELRTTLMIKNIPNKYTSKMLLATIDEQHKGTYDFIYLPIDFKNKCNVGYAFINMTDPQHIIPFYQVFNGKKWEKFNSGKVAYLAYARIQGKSALIGHFQNSSLMNEDKRCRPILFRTEGPNAGEQEPFPVPVGASTRIRRSRTNNKTNQGSASGSSSDDESPNSAKDSE